MIFEGKKLGTQQVVANCFRTPTPNIHFFILLFDLAQGLRKLHISYPVLGKNLETVFSACARGEFVLLFFVKLKIKRN